MTFRACRKNLCRTSPYDAHFSLAFLRDVPVPRAAYMPGVLARPQRRSELTEGYPPREEFSSQFRKIRSPAAANESSRRKMVWTSPRSRQTRCQEVIALAIEYADTDGAVRHADVRRNPSSALDASGIQRHSSDIGPRLGRRAKRHPGCARLDDAPSEPSVIVSSDSERA